MLFQLLPYHHPDFSIAAFASAPNASLVRVEKDFVAPENYHATTIFPEYFKVNGEWHLAKESRMDCVAVWDGAQVQIKEFRHLKAGDLVFVGRKEDGSQGIFVHTQGFVSPSVQEKDTFSFRQGRSRETAFSRDYDHLYELLRHEKEHGHIVWVLGPAVAFDSDSRAAFARLVQNGFVHGVLAGNALATHDLEGAYKRTALGQDIYTQQSYPMGHYHHIDTINRVRAYGSIPAFIEGEGIQDGIIHACVKKQVPFVLAGSIRDDGPLPEVHADVYAAQDAMRNQIRKATTVICMATTLHAIATGNMTPSFRVMPDGSIRQVYFYSVDISEFAVNKLGDRGSLSARTIVTNVQDFVVNVAKGLGV
ncbi:MAG: hypothetical protein E7329_01200 [Clostridiales bacterium]|nr:hypothetical protein [Clostridiales bacterium]